MNSHNLTIKRRSGDFGGALYRMLGRMATETNGRVVTDSDAQLADRLSTSERTIKRHLRKLVQDGLVAVKMDRVPLGRGRGWKNFRALSCVVSPDVFLLRELRRVVSLTIAATGMKPDEVEAAVTKSLTGPGLLDPLLAKEAAKAFLKAFFNMESM